MRRALPVLTRAFVAAMLGGLSASPVLAQAASTPTPTPTATLPAAATAPAGPAEPVVKRTVIEDDQNRIEELRVRGQVTSVTVQPRRGGAPAYRILPAEGGRDLSREGVPPGQRVWSVLSF